MLKNITIKDLHHYLAISQLFESVDIVDTRIVRQRIQNELDKRFMRRKVHMTHKEKLEARMRSATVASNRLARARMLPKKKFDSCPQCMSSDWRISIDSEGFIYEGCARCRYSLPHFTDSRGRV